MSNNDRYGADDDTHEAVVNLLLDFEQQNRGNLPKCNVPVTGVQLPEEDTKNKGLNEERLDDLAMNPNSDEEASLFMQLIFAGQR